MNILKNPIVLAIITGVVVFIGMSYYNKPESKKDKKDKKNKSKRNQSFFSDPKETNILVAIIASLVSWYIIYSYCEESSESNTSNTANTSNNTSNNSANQGDKAQQIGGRKIPSISEEEVTRSYNILGSGLNVPKNELKLPNVLIDVQ